ncbi:MAG: creatininase family protein [Planctomycetes bacterium]|nr:creatininase family protein [Planctomycetota bacterium]
MTSRPAEEMLPHQILEARERSGCAFVPVGPAFEWHSFHLPMGTDALVAEAVCRMVAERVGGIWLRPLSFGLDEWRPEDNLLEWGFKEEDRVFGMRFPDLPLVSEYCQAPEMRAAVKNRLDAIGGCGFRHAFLVNGHGGAGQMPTLEALAEECTTQQCQAHFVTTYRFNTVSHESLDVGGHAGLSETTWVMAFRPELVDLSRQPDGELSVRLAGILHDRPTIEARFNPRNAVRAIADDVRESVVSNFVEFVRSVAGL